MLFGTDYVIICHYCAQFTFGVVEIAKNNCIRRADRCAGRLLALADAALPTEGAFACCPGVRIGESRVVGTGGYTIFATDALLLIDKNNALLVDMGCPGRTDWHTGRVFAHYT